MKHTWRRRRVTVGVAVLSAAALALAAAVSASARDGHRHGPARPDLKSSLAPTVPTTDPTIHGVVPGAVPWQLDRGSVRLGPDGRLRVEVKGLVIPVAHGTFPAGTARPVTTVSASLYCAPDSTAAAATTAAVPISEDGNATIDERIAVPATCFAPAVLVHPNGGAGAYIAATGWR